MGIEIAKFIQMSVFAQRTGNNASLLDPIWTFNLSRLCYHFYRSIFDEVSTMDVVIEKIMVGFFSYTTEQFLCLGD